MTQTEENSFVYKATYHFTSKEVVKVRYYNFNTHFYKCIKKHVGKIVKL